MKSPTLLCFKDKQFKNDCNIYNKSRILFSFHEETNKNKAGSCHATYIICGHRRPATTNSNGHDESLKTVDDEDTFMQSSPYEGSQIATQPDPVVEDSSKSMSIVLVPEEDLESEFVI